MKISKRLQTIDSLVTKNYQHIWDCCCDHGQLGMTLLKRGAAEQLHFVDRVPSIMAQLSLTLKQQFPVQQQWRVHTLDVLDLPLDEVALGQSQLIIIAGVGGELSQRMVEHLLAKFPGHNLEFLLCPLRHQYKLRSALQKLPLLLHNEILIKESKWYYEIIHLLKSCEASTVGDNLIQARGSLMWDNATALQHNYLQQTINHYQRMLKNTKASIAERFELQQTLSAYLELQQSLNS
ncbi:MAG: hypothetical protein OFPI_38270 [Osedax symbiont Rs2]|nr:MAG: hypothetical protein OFPI_38270 [Osedax symbiont Rs2]